MANINVKLEQILTTIYGEEMRQHIHDVIKTVNDDLNEFKSTKAQANGLASLGSDGKIPDNQLPDLSIVDTKIVSSEAEMLALNVQKGDFAIRTDINQLFILRQSPASNINNWHNFGIMVLKKADVGLGNVDNTADIDKPVSTAQQNALNEKMNCFDFGDYSDSEEDIAGEASNTPYTSVLKLFSVGKLFSFKTTNATNKVIIPTGQKSGLSFTQYYVTAEYDFVANHEYIARVVSEPKAGLMRRLSDGTALLSGNAFEIEARVLTDNGEIVDFGSEAVTRKQKDDALDSRIDVEITARQNADGDLTERFDTLDDEFDTLVGNAVISDLAEEVDAPITNEDTVIMALAKLQAQINEIKENGTDVDISALIAEIFGYENDVRALHEQLGDNYYNGSLLGTEYDENNLDGGSFDEESEEPFDCGEFDESSE